MIIKTSRDGKEIETNYLLVKVGGIEYRILGHANGKHGDGIKINKVDTVGLEDRVLVTPALGTNQIIIH